VPSGCILSAETWVITGVAGFIGSHLLEAALLSDAQKAEIERHDGAMSVFDTLRGLAAGAAL